jgi:hypothetical protein
MNAPMVGSRKRLTEIKRSGQKLPSCFDALLGPCSSPQFTEAAVTPPKRSTGVVCEHEPFSEFRPRHIFLRKMPRGYEKGKRHASRFGKPRFPSKNNAARAYDYGRCKAPVTRPLMNNTKWGAHAGHFQKNRGDPALANRLPEAKRAPTCSDCHSSHYARAHLSRVEIGRQMVSVCGRCHPAQAATYLDNYHGKAAVNLGEQECGLLHRLPWRPSLPLPQR